MCPDDLAAAEPGQITALLLLASEADERQLEGPHLSVEREYQPVVTARIPQGLHSQESRREVLASTTVLDRHRKARDAELGALPPKLPGKRTTGVAFLQALVECTPEHPHRLAEGPLIGVGLEIHGLLPRLVYGRTGPAVAAYWRTDDNVSSPDNSMIPKGV